MISLSRLCFHSLFEYYPVDTCFKPSFVQTTRQSGRIALAAAAAIQMAPREVRSSAGEGLRAPRRAATGSSSILYVCVDGGLLGISG